MGCFRRFRLSFGGHQGAWWALPAANYMSRVSLEGSGPGGIRLAWDRGANREQGARVVLKQCLEKSSKQYLV